jgi:hypothetical protein
MTKKAPPKPPFPRPARPKPPNPKPLKPRRPKRRPVRALAFGWTGCADTHVAFSDFYTADHTISVWVLFQYPYAYEGPILAVQGSGNYVIGQAEAWGSLGAPESKLLICADRSQQTVNLVLENNRWYHLAAVRRGNTLGSTTSSPRQQRSPITGYNCRARMVSCVRASICSLAR